LYLGTPTARTNMSTFVPGSGDSLLTISESTETYLDPEEAPTSIPYKSASAAFTETNLQYYSNDHGGQIAYSCFAAGVDPASQENKHQLVMQITGGPMGRRMNIFTSAVGIDPEDLDGTAIDAFWPTGRPVLKSRK
ncbi:MAG: hypothetical protein GY861_24600, partial [bacterium]|nr:hypothetical protein [bacterium]